MTTKKHAAGNAAGTPDNPPFGDLARMFEQLRVPALDLKALADSQRKDMEALTQATRQAYDGMQALATRRDEILKESIAQWQAALEAGGGQALTDQAERIQQGMNKAIADLRELGELEARTRGEVWQTLQQRMQQNFADLQKLLTPR